MTGLGWAGLGWVGLGLGWAGLGRAGLGRLGELLNDSQPISAKYNAEMLRELIP